MVFREQINNCLKLLGNNLWRVSEEVGMPDIIPELSRPKPGGKIPFAINHV